MSSHDRRAAARRRAWGRGPIILRFERLEGRQLLSGVPDLVASGISTSLKNVDWGNTFHVTGTILNQGRGGVNRPFDVKLIASSTQVIGNTSVVLGTFQVPSLGAQQTTNYDEQVTLPQRVIRINRLVDPHVSRRWAEASRS